MYVGKKLADLKRFCIKIKIMPPDDARWYEFGASLIFLGLVATLVAGAITNEAEFQAKAQPPENPKHARLLPSACAHEGG